MKYVLLSLLVLAAALVPTSAKADPSISCSKITVPISVNRGNWGQASRAVEIPSYNEMIDVVTIVSSNGESTFVMTTCENRSFQTTLYCGAFELKSEPVKLPEDYKPLKTVTAQVNGETAIYMVACGRYGGLSRY